MYSRLLNLTPRVIDGLQLLRTTTSRLSTGVGARTLMLTVYPGYKKILLLTRTVIFPEVLKAICQCAALQVEECPLVESVAVSQPVDVTEDIPKELLRSHALTAKDWRKAQRDHQPLKLIIENL